MKVNKHNVFRVTVTLCSKEERRNVNNFSTEAHELQEDFFVNCEINIQ